MEKFTELTKNELTTVNGGWYWSVSWVNLRQSVANAVNAGLNGDWGEMAGSIVDAVHAIFTCPE